MDTLTIEGIPAYNGEYPLDISYFTNRELHLIKKVAGVRAGELTEAFTAGDNDLVVAIAAIMIQRHTHKDVNVEALWDTEAGKFTLNVEETESPEDEDESLPPSTEPVETDSESDSSEDDGLTSNGTSDRLVSVPSPIGAQG